MRIRIRRRKGRKSLTPAANRWIAMGTLAVCAASGRGPATVLCGQQRAPEDSGTAGQALPVFRFDIASGPLGEVVPAFETVTGWKIELPEAGMRSLHSEGVTGALPAPPALRRLLAGTGLTYRTAGPRVAVLEFPAVRASAEVRDSAPLSSARYTEPLRDIPQTITVIPQAVIEQQGSTTLTDVLRNVPGLTIAAGEGGTPAGDNLTLRGFSARNDIFVDGVRDLNPQSRDPFNLERVEVTKGPTSAISGRGSAGGTVNLTSKLPGLHRLVGMSLALGNADTWRGTADLNAPLNRIGAGEHSAFRLNLLSHSAGVPGRDVVKNSRWGIAPSVAFGLGTPTRLTLSYSKLKQDNISDYGIPWVPATNNALADYRDQPAPVPRDTFYGFRDRDREVLNQDTATVAFEHGFSDSMLLRSQLRYGNAGRNSVATPPRFADNGSTTINREMRSWVARDRIWDSQTDLNGEAKAFGIRHALVTGFALTSEGNTRTLRSAPNSQTTLLNPNPDDVYPGAITTNPNTGRITGNTQAAWLFDTAKFGKRWEATGGIRWDRFDANGISAAPAPVQQEVNMPSFRAGLVYKPSPGATLYASYGTSMSPSLEGLSYNTANTDIPPEKAYTAEVGAKWEVGRDVLLTGALFEVAKDNARTPGVLPTDSPQVLAGQQVSRGVELSASGAITRTIRVLGSYTFIDARIHSSNNAAEIGKFFQNTPKHSGSLWITYSAHRFTAGLGPRFMSRRFGNNTNTRYVNGFATLDAMFGYTVNKHLDLRLNLFNANNAFYFERLGGGQLVPGPGRYALFTANFHF